MSLRQATPVLSAALLLAGALLPSAALAQTKVWSESYQVPSPPSVPAEGRAHVRAQDGSAQEGSAREAPAPAYDFAPGDAVQVSAPPSQMWYPGTVDKVRDGRYFIKYSGTIAPADEWVEASRLRPLGGSGRPVKARPSPAASWKRDDVVEVSWKGKWYLASILDAGRGRYKVHYAGYDASWDEWVGPERIRAAPEGARLSQPEPTGRFVCQAFEANQLHNQGEFIVNADGTYRDTWNKKSGTWTFDRATRTLRFTGVLANGAKATYVPEHRKGMIVFDWGNGVRRDCYR